ncbi:MAG: hypothetical protein CVU02_00665, partial [Bacteroidetes bacterium HGW-Bacteroidetes-19]
QEEHTGIIWVVPNRPDAFPVNGNRTGNPGLNLAFEDFHVIEYAYLDSLYFEPYTVKLPIYQIRLQEEYAHLEYNFMYLLDNCYPGFFSHFTDPYYNEFFIDGQLISTNNGIIYIYFYDEYFDPTLVLRSNTRSYNKHMNLILRKYDIKSYSYHPFVLNGDTLWRTITILSHYQDALPLYYDLLTNNNLYEYIFISSFRTFGDSSNPCGPYSGISDEVESTFKIFPNPAQDEILISGVIPESVIVYDVLGKMVVTKFDAETNKINIKHLPDGLYILKIISNDAKMYTDKIIKQ